MDNVRNEIDMKTISEEAAFLCDAIINQEKFQITDNMLKKQEEEKKNKEIKKEREKNSKQFVLKQFEDYKAFELSHSDLSTCFYFHYKQAELETADYLSFSKQMKMLKNICKDFEEIEKMNPEYVENLYTYGFMLYLMPGFFGGNAEKSLEKVNKAIETAETTYDKVNAMIILSQICFDAGLKDEWKMCIEVLEELVPGSKQIAEIKQLNESGKSAFDAL